MISSRKLFVSAGLAYTAFVVYGSLVPFDFKPLPLDFALRNFSQIRYLRLGPDARADWVANLLLYIPLSFLLLGALARQGRWFYSASCAVPVFLFCAALSITIEFLQQFFPPRTVSLNDLLAEFAGASIGIVLWCTAGEKLRRLAELLLSEGRAAAYAALMLYVLGYLAFSLFPYDFVISAAELRAKASGNFAHWFPSRAACGGTFRCGAKLIAETAAVAPLGLLLSIVARTHGGSLIRLAAWTGFVIGLAIETLQMFLVSGLSLGVSVLTRPLGVAVGAAIGEGLKKTSLWPFLYLVRAFLPAAGTAYLILIGAVTWAGRGPWLSPDQGISRLREIRFMPFYYHYYTSESAAVTSLFGIVAMFAPLGVMYWIWRITVMREFMLRGAIQGFWLAACIAAILETGKLFLSGARPDPTNVWIGAFSATAVYVAVALSATAVLRIGPLPDEAQVAAAGTAGSGARPF